MHAACGILDRRPHGRSHVPDRHGQEDAGEVMRNAVRRVVWDSGANHSRGPDSAA
jgi:hypothetical protein